MDRLKKKVAGIFFFTTLIYNHWHCNEARHRGSISAEHGLGFKKADYIYYSKSKEAVDVMKSLKQLFDPQVTVTCPSSVSPSHSRIHMYSHTLTHTHTCTV